MFCYVKSSQSYWHCYAEHQKCCDTGCCNADIPITIHQRPEATSYAWLLLLLIPLTILLFVLAYKIYMHLMRGRNTDAENDATSSRMTINRDEGLRARRGEEIPEISFTLLPNRHQVTEPTNGASHPITPPPAYNIAILSPSAPPHDSHNKVPSYEDVMSRK